MMVFELDTLDIHLNKNNQHQRDGIKAKSTDLQIVEYEMEKQDSLKVSDRFDIAVGSHLLFRKRGPDS